MLWGKHPWGTHWELSEHIVNLMRTCWELEGNMFGNKGKMKKNQGTFGCMLQPTHWLHVFLVSKTVGHHFGPRLMQGQKLNKEEKQNLPCTPSFFFFLQVVKLCQNNNNNNNYVSKVNPF
jgi:hypothetical protein